MTPQSPGAAGVGLVARLREAGCVFAEEEAQLLEQSADDPVQLASMVERRTAGEPLEQVLGWAEFCGQRILVEPGIFVPRRRTELLARETIGLINVAESTPVICVDLCCGSGAIGAVVLAARRDVEWYATDIDPAATECARRNLDPRRSHVFTGDLTDPLPSRLRGQVAVIVANVPYVPTEAIRLLPTEARRYESRVALDGGPDGLDVVRRVAAQAPHWLAAGGHLLVETTESQASAAAAVFAGNGLRSRTVSSAEQEATVVIGESDVARVSRT